MGREDDLQYLNKLLTYLKEYAESKQILKTAKDNLKSEELRPLTAVKEYDQIHLKQYILDHAGEEPHKGLSEAVYQTKWAIYNKKKRKLTNEYYELESDNRKAIHENDRIFKENKIKDLEAIVSDREGLVEEAQKTLYSDVRMPKSFIQEVRINTLLGYFESGFADSLKEAMLLYIQESAFDDIDEHINTLEEHSSKLAANIQQQNDQLSTLVQDFAQIQQQMQKITDAISESSSATNVALSEMKTKFDELNVKFTHFSASMTPPDSPTEKNENSKTEHINS